VRGHFQLSAGRSFFGSAFQPVFFATAAFLNRTNIQYKGREYFLPSAKHKNMSNFCEHALGATMFVFGEYFTELLRNFFCQRLPLPGQSIMIFLIFHGSFSFGLIMHPFFVADPG
jgi:hypothetical protein